MGAWIVKFITELRFTNRAVAMTNVLQMNRSETLLPIVCEKPVSRLQFTIHKYKERMGYICLLHGCLILPEM